MRFSRFVGSVTDPVHDRKVLGPAKADIQNAARHVDLGAVQEQGDTVFMFVTYDRIPGSMAEVSRHWWPIPSEDLGPGDG